MPPRLRKFTLTAHVAVSVGWLGAIVSFLGLAIVGLVSEDTQLVRAIYLTMEPIGWFVLVPLSLAALLTGLVQALGTPWGLVRHYWVLFKLLITVVATIVLLMYLPTLRDLGDRAADTALARNDVRNSSPVIHASAALVLMLVTTTLSVYKPRGLTPYGRDRQHIQQP